MKFITFLLLLMPFVSLSQTQDSVIVYHGNASFDNEIVDLSNKNLTELTAIDLEVEILILDNNNLTSLPDWFVNLKNLKTLSIRNNNLTDVSILKYCENLEELYLSGNEKLQYLPSFTRCKKLRIIDVIGTGIHELPITIRGMESIAYFKYSMKSDIN